MAHVLTIALLYAALVAQVALRYGGAGGWTPSLVLLVGLAARRLSGGVVWAAAAGLICDALTGRPLGVTMLAATLTAAACGPPPTRIPGQSDRWRSLVRLFLMILAVESSARVLSATVRANPDYVAELTAATRAAAATAAVALACSPLIRLSHRFGHSVKASATGGSRMRVIGR